MIVDETETIRTFNRGAEDLLGYRAEEAVGRHFEFLVPEDLLEKGEIETVQRETVMRGSLRNYETRRIRKDGSEVEVSLTRTSIYDAQGNYIGASAILRDISERKRLVEQLIQAESLAEVGELAAQVAHEIKNPLAGISAAIQLLAATYPERDPRASVFGEILDHIRRLDDTVKTLLEFTRPYTPNLQRLDLDMILDSTLSMLEASEVFSDITVERNFARDARTVLADSQLMIQVLMNLLINAAQAVIDDRRLLVASHRAGDEIVIEVTDHGPGIPPEVLKQVLKPFFTTKSKGTGLGLPIARKLVEAHAGTLEVESETGAGTTVRIRLPTIRAPSEEKDRAPFSPMPR
jgi:PAS domain S-box-containing protein